MYKVVKEGVIYKNAFKIQILASSVKQVLKILTHYFVVSTL
jgi:hypothetical protein